MADLTAAMYAAGQARGERANDAAMEHLVDQGLLIGEGERGQTFRPPPSTGRGGRASSSGRGVRSQCGGGRGRSRGRGRGKGQGTAEACCDKDMAATIHDILAEVQREAASREKVGYQDDVDIHADDETDTDDEDLDCGKSRCVFHNLCGA